MRDLTGRRQRDVNNERRLKEYDELFIPQLSHFFLFCIATTDPMAMDPTTTDPTTTETTELTTTKSKTTESDPTTTNPTNLHSSLYLVDSLFAKLNLCIALNYYPVIFK